MSFLYQVLIVLFTITSMPFFFYEYFKKGKYRGKLREKLGLKKLTYQAQGPVIWVHAVSVGEVKGVRALLQKIREDQPEATLIVSSVTTTGHQESKKTLSFADYHVLLPLDFKGAIQNILGDLEIDLLLLMEGDIWPNFVNACKARGARIGIINAKLSDRSFRRLQKIKLFTNWYFKPFDFFLVQDEVYKERFRALVGPEKSIEVIANLKLDDVYPNLSPEDEKVWRERFSLKGPILSLGSTHEGEEKALLKQIAPLFKKYKSLKVLLVPRHPERCDAVEEIIKENNLSYARYSKVTEPVNVQVILMDKMGLLRTCYALSTVAVVAGSFTSKVGGHNILEPFWYYVPSVYGPYMHTQAQFVHLAKVTQSGIQTPIEGLQEKLTHLLENPEKRRELGERGREIFNKASGGTEVTFNFIKKTLVDKAGLV